MLPILLAQLLTLSGPMAEWADEIGRLTGSPIAIFRLKRNQLPEAEPHRRLISLYRATPSFESMFQAAQALSVNPKDTLAKYQYVLLNDELAPRDAEGVQGLIAHELGHLWIKSQGFATAQYVPGKTACLSVVTGDVVQHVVIRHELDSREIQWRPAWIGDVDAALVQMEKNTNRSSGDAPVCQKLAQILLWVDVELGLSKKDWPRRARFLAVMRRRFPEVAAVAVPLTQDLRKLQLLNKQEHRTALIHVFGLLKQFAIAQQE